MKVNELVEKVLNGEDLNDLDINDYVPIEDKRNIAIEVLEECTDNNDGYLHIDHFKKDVCFTVAMLREYAHIEFSYLFDDMLYEYDELCQYGIIEMLISMVNHDYKRAKKILECEEKKLVEKNSLEAQVAKIANVVTVTLQSLTELINDKVKDFDINKILPEGTDIDNLMEMLNRLK